MKLQIAFLFMVLQIGSLAFGVAVESSLVSDFEESRLAAESHWGGSFTGETGFESGSGYFPHNQSEWGYWSGFAYSNRTDMTTAGYTNEFSAYVDGGHGNTSGNQYAICYVDSYADVPTISLTGELYNSTISGMWVSNTTYTYLSMLNGDGFAKKFGGESGTDADYFSLSITGITAEASMTEPVTFMLADFSSDDSSQDYIVNTWTWVDLSGLGDIVGLQFGLASSDNGMWGMNTPSYFAFDNFNGSPLQAPAVPEPGSMIMLIAGAVIAYKRR